MPRNVKVLVGFGEVPDTNCQFCGASYGMFRDDGDSQTIQYQCWCGATARVRRDDPDLIEFLTSK